MEQTYEKRGYLLEDFRLFHLQDAQGTQVGLHYHEFCKLLLLRSGTGSYQIDGQRYTLLPGDVVLVGSRCVHRPEFKSGVPYERTIIYISPQFLQKNSAGDCDLLACFSGSPSHVLRLPEIRRQFLFSLADQLEQELSGVGYGREIISRCLLLRFLVELGRAAGESAISAPVQPRNTRVLEILRYLDSHLVEDISIDTLAETFFLSKYHMMRLFRRETGLSIHGYLTERRLLRARELLAAGKSATDACFLSGFRSYSSFARAWGKRFSSTPTGRPGLSLPAEETYE